MRHEIIETIEDKFEIAYELLGVPDNKIPSLLRKYRVFLEEYKYLRPLEISELMVEKGWDK